MSELTRILEAMQRGEPQAAEELLAQIYQELRRLAQWHMSREAPVIRFRPRRWCTKPGCG